MACQKQWRRPIGQRHCFFGGLETLWGAYVILAQKKQTELKELIQADFVAMLEQCHEEVLRLEDEIPDVLQDIADQCTAAVKLDLRSLKHFRGFLENVVQPLNGYEDLYECGKLPASCPECRSRRYDVCQVKYLQWHGKCRKCGHVHLILSEHSVVPVAPERKIPQETAFSLGLLHAMGMRLDKTQEFAIGEHSHINLLGEVQDWATQIGKLLADGIAREIEKQSVVAIDEMRITPENQLAAENFRSPGRGRLVVHTSGHMEEHLGIVFKCVDEKQIEAEADACVELESYLSKVISRREQKEQLSLSCICVARSSAALT